jgi:hypothetical protein
MKMDPKIKEKWIEALRSGKYEQGEGTLNKDNKFCCLGVLCEVVGLEKHFDSFSLKTLYAIGSDEDGGIYLEDDLGPNCRKYFNIDVDNEKILVNMNDGNEDYRIHSFNEIADWIEKSDM